MPLDNPGSGIVGEPIDGEPPEEADHFIRCPSCNQLIDLRDFGQVLHHEEPGHEPIPPEPQSPPPAGPIYRMTHSREELWISRRTRRASA